MPKILFLNAYYKPEITADTHLDDDLIRHLIKSGYQIIVLCPKPTRGITKEQLKQYKGRKIEQSNDNMLTVRRFWAPREKTNVIFRAIRYLYCNLRQYQIACRLRDIDLIYCISTPPTQGLLSALVKKKISKKTGRDIKNIYYLEDVFPDTLVAAGIAKENSFLWKIGRRIESYTYYEASKIVTISKGCVMNIVNKGADKNKIAVINNWIDLSNTQYVNRDNNSLFDEFGLDKKKFYIVYAGNLGKAQNIDLLIDAAKAFELEKKINFVLFGSGGEESRIKERIVNERIENIKVLPLQPPTRVSEVYSLGDADIVICKKGFGKSALPSKTWSIMATARPVIASFDKDGDLCRLLKEYNCGLCAEADDLKELISAITKIYSMEEADRLSMGENGREYVMKCRDMTACVSAFEEIINQMIIKEEKNESL